jgi:hypothetical protein
MNRYDKLAKDLEKAAEAGIRKMEMQDGDGGASNFDRTYLRLPRWREEKVKKAAEKAGLWAEKRTSGMLGTRFSIGLPDEAGKYQGNKRTAAAEGMWEVLKDLGYDGGVYYHMD